jgi:hypothetical protein
MIIAPGYFLTWHTYGTWLHGDDAGSVDETHNQFGTPRVGPDPERLTRELQVLRNPPVVLDTAAPAVVDDVMRRHCALRRWTSGPLPSVPTMSTSS